MEMQMISLQCADRCT